MNQINSFCASFYGILCPGLTSKTKLSFTSLNSSFTECVRSNYIFSLHAPSINFHDITDTLELWKDEYFSDNDHKPVLSSTVGDHSFTSCTFVDLSSEHNGGAICYTYGSSLFIDQCTFTRCKTTESYTHSCGGGAVYTISGTLSVISTSFLCCTTSSFGGGIFSYSSCSSSDIKFSIFIDCNGQYGGGVNTYCGPTSSITSSRFLMCTGTASAGGFYHDSNSGATSISVSDSLFAHNCAAFQPDELPNRGGGGFETYRSQPFPFHYAFLFFHGNIAKNNVGHDITSHAYPLPDNTLVYSFTTTAENSFSNSGHEEKDWLPLTTVSLLLSQSLSPLHFSLPLK